MSKEENTVSTSAPGARLRAERERRGQAVGDIAAQLRLDGSVIQALEADDYDRLPAAIFVKGYIRSYGKLMQMDIDALWFDYRALAAPEEHSLVSNSAPQKETDYRKFVWILLAALIVVGIFSLAFWSSGKPADPVDTNDVLPEVNNSDDESTSTSEVESVDELLARIQSGGSADANPSSEENDPDDAYEPPANLYSSQSGSDEAAETASAPVDEPVEPVAEPEAAPVAETQEEPVSDASDIPLMAIEVSVTDEAWVSIKDADENRLVRDLLDSGESVQARGVAPLMVNLGQAHAVVIKVNGEVFEHAKYHRPNKTARFEIKAN